MTRFERYIKHNPQYGCVAWVKVKEDGEISDVIYPIQGRSKSDVKDYSTEFQVENYRKRGFNRCYYLPKGVEKPVAEGELISDDGRFARPALNVSPNSDKFFFETALESAAIRIRNEVEIMLDDVMKEYVQRVKEMIEEHNGIKPIH